MTKSINIILQCALGFGQVVAGPAVAAFMLPEVWATLVHSVLAGLTVVVGILAHTSNPDGTPATTAFVPKP